MKEYQHKREPNLTAVKSYDYLDHYLILGTNRSLLFIVPDSTFFKDDWELTEIYTARTDPPTGPSLPSPEDLRFSPTGPAKPGKPIFPSNRHIKEGSAEIRRDEPKEPPVNAPGIPTDPDHNLPRLYKMPGPPLSQRPPLDYAWTDRFIVIYT